MKITQKIKIGDREVPLLFNLSAMAQMEESIGQLNDFKKLLTSGQRVRSLIRMLVIFGNEGLRQTGGKADLTEEMVGTLVHPSRIMEIQSCVMGAISEGLTMETKPDDGRERDLVLEELEKKEAPSR